MTHKLSLGIVRWFGAEGANATAEYYRRGFALAFIAGLLFIARSVLGFQFFYRIGAVSTCAFAMAAACLMIFGSAWMARKMSVSASLVLTVVAWTGFLLLAMTLPDIF
jgi:hypothetical protein